MTIFGTVFFALLVVLASGAYHIHLRLSAKLSKPLGAFKAKRLSLVVISMMLAAMLAPYLTPASPYTQLCVWVLYLAFAGAGAWRIYLVANTAARLFKSARLS